MTMSQRRRLVPNLRRACLAALLFAAAPPAPAETSLLIDGFDYADSAAARAVWQAYWGTPMVEMADSGAWGAERVMRMPCNYSAQPYRCVWGRPVSLDLSGYATFALDVFVADSTPVGDFTLYFHSGGGWFAKNAEVTQSGWQTLRFDRIGFWTEGTPAGWNQVDSILLSPWKEFGRDTYFAARDLRALTPDLLILRDVQSLDPGTVERTTALLFDRLGSWGIRPAAVDGAFVSAGGLAGARMVILPYNETVPDAQMTRIEEFVAAGGKLMVYYRLNSRLQQLLAIDLVTWLAGEFASYTLADAAIPHLPPRVAQDSWNIMVVAPRAERTRA